MVQETANHGLNKYEAGDTDWTHSPDMQHIEERLVIKDTEANRSNYTPHPTATYVATDSGVVYDGDGSSWNAASRAVQSFSAGDYSAGIARITDAFDAVEVETLNYQWDAQSAAGVGVYGDGGDFTVGPDGGSLTTEATADAAVRTEDPVSQSWNEPTWDRRRRLRVSLTVPGSDHGEVVEVGTGSMQGASADKQLGVRIVDNNVYARIGDGSSAMQVLLQEGVTVTSRYDIFVDYDPRGDTREAAISVESVETGADGATWAASQTFSGDAELPSGETTDSKWLAWSSYAATPDGIAMDVAVDMVNFVAYPP
ncbi:hypothetical protein [Haloarcula amylovorans]|uniref:hypothetical protein n=1 Tax=Haloarcula amylovorans TaxID=2562280 RepID=UPI0010768688|nr:hypothetical protein [Halomicroarcula amylolytica]